MRLILIFIAALVCLTLPPTALAASKGSGGVFLLAPARIDKFQADPGFSSAGLVTLYTLQPNRRYKVSVLEGNQNKDGAVIWTPQSTDPRDPSAWVKLNETTIDGGTLTRIPIVWTLNTPQSAQPGDHLIAIAVTLIPTKAEQETPPNVQGVGAHIMERFAVPVVFTVSGAQTFAPDITEIRVPKISSATTVPISTTIKNRGNTRIDMEKAKARLEVLVSGKVVKSFPLDWRIYPGSTRVYQFVWSGAPVFAKAEARVSMDFRSQGYKRVSEKTAFYIIPFKIIGLILLILIGVIWMIVAARKSSRAHKAKESAASETVEK